MCVYVFCLSVRANGYVDSAMTWSSKHVLSSVSAHVCVTRCMYIYICVCVKKTKAENVTQIYLEIYYKMMMIRAIFNHWNLFQIMEGRKIKNGALKCGTTD